MARWSAAARPLTHVTSPVSDRAAAPFCARGLPDRSPARTTRAYRSALDELRNITIRTYLYNNILYNYNNIIFALVRMIYYIIVIVVVVVVVVVSHCRRRRYNNLPRICVSVRNVDDI